MTRDVELVDHEDSEMSERQGGGDSLASVSRDTLYMVSGQIFSKVFSFAYILLLARHLSVEDFGRFNLIMSFVLIAEIGADFGLSRLMMKDMARSEDVIPKYLGALLPLKIPLSIIAYGAMLLVLWLAGYSIDILQLAAIAGVCLLPSGLAMAFDNTLHARQRFHYLATTQIFLAFSQLVLGGITLYLTAKLSCVLVVMILSYICYLCLLYFFTLKNDYKYKLHWDWGFCRKILHQSFPYMIIAILYIFAARAEMLMLSRLVTDAAIGIYSAASKIPEAAIFVPMMFTSVLGPILSRLHGDSKEGLTKLYGWSSRSIVLAMVPCAFIGILLAEPIFLFLFSEKYAESIPVLKTILLVFPLTSLYILNSTVMYTSDHQIQSMVVFLLLTVIQYTLNYFLINERGLDGAMDAFVLSTIINAAVTTLLVRLWFINRIVVFALFPPLVASAVLTLSYFYFPIDNVVIKPLLALILFALCAYGLWRLMPTRFETE